MQERKRLYWLVKGPAKIQEVEMWENGSTTMEEEKNFEIYERKENVEFVCSLIQYPEYVNLVIGTLTKIYY